MNFTREEVVRYSRHIILPEVGGRGQERLRATRVLVSGEGPVAAAVATYLAAAGVGLIGLAPPLGTRAAAAPQAAFQQELRADLRALNPGVEVRPCNGPVSPGLAAGYDLVAWEAAGPADWEGANAIMLGTGRPAAVAQARGYDFALTSLLPGGPCLACLPGWASALGELAGDGGEMPRRADEVAAAGAVALAAGAALATEALKLALGLGQPLAGRLLRFCGREHSYRERRWHKAAACPACGGAGTADDARGDAGPPDDVEGDGAR